MNAVTGLYHKYNVERTDGSTAPGGKHNGEDYFVLNLTTDKHAIPAVKAYANSCERERPVLATDLRAKLRVKLHTSMTSEFVTVPETVLPDGTVVPAFQVGKYMATIDDEGKAIVSAETVPTVNVNFRNAHQACENAGLKLIRETQALAIACNIYGVDANWTGGKVGEGDLYQGLHDHSVGQAMPGTYTPGNPLEQRWFTLSNGERICDAAGNIYSWVFDDVQGDKSGIVNRPFTANSPSISCVPVASAERGVGWYPPPGRDWSGRALIRGGCWGSGSYTGVFRIDVGWPGDDRSSVGFRCTKPIEMEVASKSAAMLDDTPSAGLYHKFHVERTDGSSAAGGKHDGDEYFVLNLTSDKHAIPALKAYITSCESEFPVLASDLRAKLRAMMPSEFVIVPETTLPNGTVVPEFQVGRYMSTVDNEGKATVQADTVPTVNINYHDAVNACESVGLKLIRESQALAIAWNIYNVDSNWSGGQVGAGTLYQGMHDHSVSQAMDGNFLPVSASETRWFTLSNGARICDAAGNIYTWVFDDIQGNDSGIVSRAFTPESLSISSAPVAPEENGIGWYPPAGRDWSGRALIRGGCWGSGASAGIYRLDVGWPGDDRSSVGFRCTKEADKKHTDNEAAVDRKQIGLYHKYNVERTDGSSAPGGKHYNDEYFVLNMSTDKHAAAALKAYAASCEREYPALAADLRAKLRANLHSMLPTEFIIVPETMLPNGVLVPEFRVGKYFCTVDSNGNATVQAETVPTVNISYHAARKACDSAGLRLLTETQSLAIAWNIYNVNANWSSGKVGEGTLFQGLHSHVVSQAMAGTFMPTNPTETRWFTLSNGSRICDAAGNIYSWIFDDIQGDSSGVVSRPFSNDSASISTPPVASEENGIGWYPPAGRDWSGRALIRGGCWGSGSSAGVYRLDVGWPGDDRSSVGFRCTKP